MNLTNLRLKVPLILRSDYYIDVFIFLLDLNKDLFGKCFLGPFPSHSLMHPDNFLSKSIHTVYANFALLGVLIARGTSKHIL